MAKIITVVIGGEKLQKCHPRLFLRGTDVRHQRGSVQTLEELASKNRAAGRCEKDCSLCQVDALPGQSREIRLSD
jgi:hypothetical protein